MYGILADIPLIICRVGQNHIYRTDLGSVRSPIKIF